MNHDKMLEGPDQMTAGLGDLDAVEQGIISCYHHQDVNAGDEQVPDWIMRYTKFWKTTERKETT